MLVLLGIGALLVFAAPAVARDYGPAWTLALLVAVAAGAWYLPWPTLLSCAALGAWLRLGPLMRRW